MCKKGVGYIIHSCGGSLVHYSTCYNPFVFRILSLSSIYPLGYLGWWILSSSSIRVVTGLCSFLSSSFIYPLWYLWWWILSSSSIRVVTGLSSFIHSFGLLFLYYGSSIHPFILVITDISAVTGLCSFIHPFILVITDISAVTGLCSFIHPFIRVIIGISVVTGLCSFIHPFIRVITDISAVTGLCSSIHSGDYSITCFFVCNNWETDRNIFWHLWGSNRGPFLS